MADKGIFLLLTLVSCCVIKATYLDSSDGITLTHVSKRSLIRSTEDHDGHTANKRNIDNFATCEDGWVPHGDSCYHYNDTEVINEEAANTCLRLHGHLVFLDTREEKSFAAGFLPRWSGKALWLGARYVHRAWGQYGWKWIEDPNDKDTGSWLSRYSDEVGWYDQYWSDDTLQHKPCARLSSNEDWLPVNCEEEQLPFLCERPPPCKAGWFGEDCSRLCHCSGDRPCDQHTGLCPKGCNPGWTGSACDISDRLPEATYHCLRTWDGSLSADVTMDAADREFTVVRAVSQAGDPLLCRLTVRHHDNNFYIPLNIANAFDYDVTAGENATTSESSPGNATAKRKTNVAEGFDDLACTASGIDNMTVTWLIEFKRYEGVTTGDDVTIEVRCNLDDVEDLELLNSIMDNSEIDHHVFAQKSPVVSLVYITDRSSGQRLDQYHMGNVVLLHVDVLGLTSYECAIPHTCIISSADNDRRNLMLIDENGCAVEGLPVTDWKAIGFPPHNFTSNPFPALSLGASQLNVACEVDVVYELDHSLCTDPCQYTYQQKLKDTSSNEINSVDANSADTNSTDVE